MNDTLIFAQGLSMILLSFHIISFRVGDLGFHYDSVYGSQRRE